MFTGIIENLGIVINKTKSQLEIKASGNFMQKVISGMSISVNGICLTVINFGKESFKADFIPETEEKTNINFIKTGDQVNLELPATPKTFLSGHIVQGHVDGIGKLIKIQKDGNSKILKISIPKKILRYLVSKGSVALNGISLTIISTEDDMLTVGFIPATWEKTMINKMKTGDFINIEVDILAKYIERLITK